MKNNNLIYETNCVNFPAPLVDHLMKMIDDSEDVSFETLRKNVNLDSLKDLISTVFGHTQASIKRDWAVHFYKSKLFDTTVYYIDWSAIEYIFTPNGNLIHEQVSKLHGWIH